ncbi:unnamed protein product [Phytophthora fragariaefolia]|uniref:Unnamed protein product n=1 Tax=Phytophthora fragariaefolia TaxID=1490495 RepID=A0A9W6U9Q8_9STRA|nr:unnamed protein product [Phytophthora fragariaefolia]
MGIFTGVSRCHGEVMGSKADEGWGGVRALLHWDINQEGVSMIGCHEPVAGNVNLPTIDSYSRELGTLFEAIIPPVVRLCAVGGAATETIEAWQQLRGNSTSRGLANYAWTFEGNLPSPAIGKMTIELIAQTAMTCFSLTLDSRNSMISRRDAGNSYAQQELKVVAENTGFLLSTLVCGCSLCDLKGVNPTLQLSERYPQPIELELKCDWASDIMVAAICSAVAEPVLVNNLKFYMGERWGRHIQILTPKQWGWLVYALCATGSDVPTRKLICNTKMSLTQEYVLTTAAVLQTGYQEPALVRSTPPCLEYGFADVPKGTKLWPNGLACDDPTTFVLSRDQFCRAAYIPAVPDTVNVVVPGYGVCKMGVDARQFLRISPSVNCGYIQRSRCIQVLDLELLAVESESLLKELLLLIGGGLRKLSLRYSGDNEACVMFDDLATACPDLEKLTIDLFVVVLRSNKFWRGSS